eukprot:TRINITY_DN464_c0_g2_i1.p1 TRINITY_DN464_c0_g2~~TRINITY_DN464_c0_g2_i1.p1  ORF type:complete len:1660 (+),score=594.70 TRINITY_DN464_c0_g2_i1:519-5498(+)
MPRTSHSSGGFNKNSFQRHLEVLRSNIDSIWVDQFNFQQNAVEIAWHKLGKRSIGWFNHHNVWSDDAEESHFHTAWESFSKKHFKAYNRWKKITGAAGGFDLKVDETLEQGINKIFLYYLVYAEIQDFRGLKNVFHLFFHVASGLFQDHKATEVKVGTWLRTEGNKLYRFLGLVYNKDEMNQDCFHHDDLDDLCATHTFAKAVINEKDFFKALKVEKYKSLNAVLSLDTPTFIVYWLKSSQGELNSSLEKQRAREDWILNTFAKPTEKTVITEYLRKAEEFATKARQANNEMKESQEVLSASDRYRPMAEDFDEKPDQLQIFTLALTQLDAARELFFAAEEQEKTGAGVRLKEAKTKHFNVRMEAEKSFDSALSGYRQLTEDYEECEMGLRRAYEGFTDRNLASSCKAYAAEARYLLAKAAWKKVAMEEMQERVKASRFAQFLYEDSVNNDRREFAKRNKTFFEKAGGVLGLSGYLTVIYHYSHAAYLHLLMLIPLMWLYFDYHDVIGAYPNVGAGIKGVIRFDGSILDMYNNLVLSFAIPLGLTALLWIILNLFVRWRTRGAKSAPRRDTKCDTNIQFGARMNVLMFWFFTIVTEIVVMKFLVINPIRGYTRDWVDNFRPKVSIPLLIINWVPIVVLYLCSLQFIFTIWIGIFGFIYGLIDRVANVQHWRHVIAAFEPSSTSVDSTNKSKKVPRIAVEWHEKVSPKQTLKGKNGELLEDNWQRRYVAFAKVWNLTIQSFYESHKISKEELQRYSFKIKMIGNEADFLSGHVEKEPDLRVPPQVKDVRMHIMHFVNNIRMKKPTHHSTVREMLPLCIVTPVGTEKILYSFEFIIHVDNTQNSFLQHLIDRDPSEWENFKRKECLSDKARDWINRMEKDVLQGSGEAKAGKKSRRWIDSTDEGLKLKTKISEWASVRFQALYRTVYGFMQVPKALALLARIQDPFLTQEKAEELANSKFTYLIGYQSYAGYFNTYKRTKSKGREGANLSKEEIEAHESVFFIKHIRKRFPEVKICYPEHFDGKYFGRLVSGVKASKASTKLCDYKVQLFGPFADLGLGKPAHQNYISQFIDGMIIQTIDINQDNVLPQSFFIPNTLAEFRKDPKVKIVGLPEFVITTKWSSTAWCSAFSEHTFGTLTQRTYARFGVRLHYGHPDYIDALWTMTETGLSKLPYVSEDIFTGFDTVLKGGRIIHIEYHEVGKARDVDLYTTTKFQRKISMGASQMSCSRYIDQMQTCWSVSVLQGLCYYYSTVGFYFNHLILYLSVWVALSSQLLLIILQRFVYGSAIAYFITERIFVFQVGFALVLPGVLQLVLEYGVIQAAWMYISHFFILCVYSTFHILNISSFWQYGLTHSAFYLASGRGTGLEHYFMKDLYTTFYKTHWRPGFIIFWMGIIALAFSRNFAVFLVMYLLPSGIWLWGATFLNPGSLPSTVHEEQWKRLTNIDLQQTAKIVKSHTRIDYHPSPIKRNFFFAFFIKIWRLVKYTGRILHWLYTILNFAVFTRVVRFIGVITLLFEWIFASRIPTFIFTDERRRVLRWDDDDTRQKSIFYSSMIRKEAVGSGSDPTSPITKKSTLPTVPAVRGHKARPLAPEPVPSSTNLLKGTAIQGTGDAGNNNNVTDDRPLPNIPARTIKRNRSVRFIREGESSGDEEEEQQNITFTK